MLGVRGFWLHDGNNLVVAVKSGIFGAPGIVRMGACVRSSTDGAVASLAYIHSSGNYTLVGSFPICIHFKILWGGTRGV